MAINTSIKKDTIKTGAAPATHLEVSNSQLINRIGVHFRDKYCREPSNPLQKCAYFSIHQTVPGLKTSGYDFEAMKNKAEELYSSFTSVEREQLRSIYLEKVHYQDGFAAIDNGGK